MPLLGCFSLAGPVMEFLRAAIAKFSTSFKLLSLGYLSQFYSSVVSLGFSPFILATIGVEAYGLVGIFCHYAGVVSNN